MINGLSQWALGIDIPDIPLEVMVKSPPPVIMFLIDDSTSMNASILAESDNRSLSTYLYVFNDPENHVVTSLISQHTIIPPELNESWKARCVSFNHMYYDPLKTYDPWPHWTVIANQESENNNAHMDHPRFHPLTATYLNLDEPYFTTGSMILSHAHFFSFDDLNDNHILDPEELLFLIELSGTKKQICAWQIIEPQYGTNQENMTGIPFSQLPDSIRLDTNNEPITYTSQRQNFANWFSFHRRKELEIKYQVGSLIDHSNPAYIGLYSFNQSLNVPVSYIDHTSMTHQSKINLLKAVYSYISEGDSPLRHAYQIIGDYLETGKNSVINGRSPFNQNSDADACRQAFVIVLTDGYYNGPSPDIGNIDGDNLSPYRDSYSNTFSDMVMYYYERDLAPAIPNMVPPVSSDLSKHQHLVPFIIVFGSQSAQAYDHMSVDHYPVWPKPLPGTGQTIIDLYHGALNGRGLFAKAGNLSDFTDIKRQIHLQLHDSQSRTSQTVQLGQQIQGKKRIIKASYNPAIWTGDLKAYDIMPTEINNTSSSIWSATEQLENLFDQQRHIFTFNGDTGIPFQENNMDVSIVTTEQVKMIRQQSLGDIVHSSPLIVNQMVWVGANDGMLHAFDLNTGIEKLAYLPHKFWPYLHLLADPEHHHTFFVDGNLYAKQINDQVLLCVAAGRGGKGVFCLDITTTDQAIQNERNFAKKLVMWEYAPSDDPDLGYIQQAYIVHSNHNHQPVVIFGNGYNSDGKQAFLYILNALTGLPLKYNGQTCKKGIELPSMSNENGLSTPALVDINSDNRVDFIYAGDLQGNLWKFDCQSSNPNQWHVFYETEYDKSPAPLFQAQSSNGIVQPITIRPEVIRHCDSRFSGYLIMFGTGKYFESIDIDKQDPQSLYVIWDWADFWHTQKEEPLSTVKHRYLGAFNSLMDGYPNIRKPDHTPSNVTLSCQDIDRLDHTETIPSVDWDPASDRPHIGWYMDLHSGERVISPLTYLGSNILMFNSFTPNGQPCRSSGTSRMYVINISTAVNYQEFFESMSGAKMSPFFQPVIGLMTQPLISFQGNDQIILYLSSSDLPSISQITLTMDTSHDLKGLFDQKIFYWKAY
jgi:type IV pilus assembly protein PilY1